MLAHPLDNPIWTALTTSQAHWAQTSKLARKFPVEIGPLAAFEAPTRAAYESMAEIFPAGGVAAICLDAPPDLPTTWILDELAPMLQMIYTNCKLPPPSRDFVELTAADAPEMLALATLTKPGPFALHTHELGDFICIRREGKLAAMAGERLRAPGYTEVSAVCTHPDHLGHGYATGLMVEIMRRILARGETPFLHVRSGNLRAIELYRRLGYVDRHLFQLTILRKNATAAETLAAI
jgi:ribosomal protein S18 acetylase RimI-like enzyme